MSYGQFLLNTQANYTGTYFADMVSGLDHNSVYRYLKHAKMAPRMIWEKTSQFLEPSEDGYVIFDDTVADKASASTSSLLVRNTAETSTDCEGIGVVTACTTTQTEIAPMHSTSAYCAKGRKDQARPCGAGSPSTKETRLRTVLMDSWYADGHDSPTKVLERRPTAPQIKSVGS